jgi:hypothetical protein
MPGGAAVGLKADVGPWFMATPRLQGPGGAPPELLLEELVPQLLLDELVFPELDVLLLLELELDVLLVLVEPVPELLALLLVELLVPLEELALVEPVVDPEDASPEPELPP